MYKAIIKKLTRKTPKVTEFFCSKKIDTFFYIVFLGFSRMYIYKYNVFNRKHMQPINIFSVANFQINDTDKYIQQVHELLEVI